MAQAFGRAFASGAVRVVILGSDIPHLPDVRIQQAFEALTNHNCVLGPSEDGGYYLIGCSRFDPCLFHEVEWGSPRVLEQTLANAARWSYRVKLLDPWYDLDQWSDIERLREEALRGAPLPAHLEAFFENLKMEKGNSA